MSRGVRPIAISIVASVVALAGVDHAASTRAPLVQTTNETRSVSVGSPNEGRLDGGMHLPDAPYLRVVPAYLESHARWGLPALVSLIDRAARQVARRYPGSVLGVGDLSRRGGGELDRHHSHESG